jgi:hypothetical protein
VDAERAARVFDALFCSFVPSGPAAILGARDCGGYFRFCTEKSDGARFLKTLAKNCQSGSGYVKNLSLKTRVSNRFFLQKTTWYILIFF